ncbi:RNA-binding protein S4 [Thalassobaculum fulvum]|jgi:ribosome-associated heat shock protein Hsp15|uniref:RNA-binding protein S4 n=1 Tax=Thalassobaculum fulvum TaxID=1633335 RepID=A0A918XPW6_9PROT|nr:RNA-binding S4 domain-containing protein [Thalassobaculum fulvum]GHD41978.1 RNA-binding protein S4 [Thalassobaculum fulvum]
MTGDDPQSQRLDKWLWCARFFKSRSLANALLAAGRLRLSGTVVGKAHQKVKVGDVLTFPQGPHVRVVKVLALAVRRGPAPEAQGLYEDLAPVPERRPEPSDPAMFEPEAPSRERGAGRPTKKDRRALDRLAGDEG